MYTVHGYCLRTRAFSMQHCTKIKSVRKVEFRLCPKIFPSENFLLYSISKKEVSGSFADPISCDFTSPLCDEVAVILGSV